MKRRLSALYLFLLLLASACSRQQAATPSASEAVAAPAWKLAPRKDWRMAPVQVVSPTGQQEPWQALKAKQSTTWEFDLPGDPWVAIQLPAQRADAAMLTFEYREQPTTIALSVATSSDSTNGTDGTWTERMMPKIGKRLDKIVVEPNEGSWLRVKVLRVDKSLNPVHLKFINMGLYSLSHTEKNDYWLAVGASIQAMSLRQDLFHKEVTERFSDYDPVQFNEAIGGWRTEHLRDNIEEILARHPYASYVTIHIGGNNITAERPYPGGVEVMEKDIRFIVDAIRAHGKEPILSRISYRAYKESKTKPGVPPEENGSGPYVKNLYDPLIKELCPRFYDENRDQGMVDPYTYFKEHQDELTKDGVHVVLKGQETWNRLWAEQAGGVVYGHKSQDVEQRVGKP